MRFVIKWGIYIKNIKQVGVYSSTTRSAPCRVDYRFSDTNIRLIIYTTKQNRGLFNIISIYLSVWQKKKHQRTLPQRKEGE
jgi:hypothetical protein